MIALMNIEAYAEGVLKGRVRCISDFPLQALEHWYDILSLLFVMGKNFFHCFFPVHAPHHLPKPKAMPLLSIY